MEATMIAPLRADLKRVLIVLPSWVGDTVMATPVLRTVRAALPEAHIIGAARPGLKELLAGTPWINEWIETSRGGLFQPLAVSRRIRAMSPDAALLLPNSFRTALAVALARVPIRIGYARDGRQWLLTNPIEVIKSDEPMPTLNYYAHLAERALGCALTDLRMELAIADEESRTADDLLRDVTQPFVLLNPGGNKPAKRWPAERFAAVADALHERLGLGIAVTGSPNERDVIDAVVASVKKPIVNLASRGISLPTLKAVIKRAALLITNDTGPRHIAAALGTPTVTLFGPTDHRWTTLQQPGAAERLLLADPFLTAELIADKCPDRCGIDRISVADVVAAAEQLYTGGSR